MRTVILTDEQAAAWRDSLTARMRIRQEVSAAAGPRSDVQIVEVDTIAAPLDRWTVPACSASGAW